MPSIRPLRSLLLLFLAISVEALAQAPAPEPVTAADPAALLKKHVARVAHVHCKDVRPQVIAQARQGDWSFLQGVVNGIFTVPGDGALDFEAVLRTLRDAGYQGWLVVEAEQDPAIAPGYAYAKKGYETPRPLRTARAA